MISVYIRTYEGDLEWLRYCLASLHRNLTGWDEIVVCIPESQVDKLQPLITSERVVTCPTYTDDYIGQQVSKLQAHLHVRGEFILFVDSDLVFHPGAKVSDYFQDTKPVILKQSYTRLVEQYPELNYRKWQDVVNLVFGNRPYFEYMQRSPMLFRTKTLVALDQAFPLLADLALRQPYRLFTEYNVLGYFAECQEPSEYVFLDLEHVAPPPNLATQHWSWGGITPEIFAYFVLLGVADPKCPPDYSRLPILPSAPKPFSRWKRFRYAVKRFFRGS